MKRETIEKEADSYAAIVRPSFVNGEFDRNAIAQAFEDGAKWRINAVWHDGAEMPGYKQEFIYQAVRASGKVYCNMLTIFEAEEWELLKECTTIERWAYVRDLFPGGKEEYNESR